MTDLSFKTKKGCGVNFSPDPFLLKQNQTKQEKPPQQNVKLSCALIVLAQELTPTQKHSGFKVDEHS